MRMFHLCTLGAAVLAGAMVAAPAAGQTDTITRSYATCDPTGGTCGAGVPIPDSGGGPAFLPLTIPSDPGGNVILRVSADIWIQHTYQGDLRVELISPGGIAVRLMDRPGLAACPS